MSETIRTGFWIAICVIGLMAIFLIADYQQSLPDVITSYSTGKCVSVTFADGTAGSCDQLPEKYHHYWGR